MKTLQAYFSEILPEKYFLKNFQKTLAFFLELCYNITHKCFSHVLDFRGGVAKWQNVQFVERALHLVIKFLTPIEHLTELGSPMYSV